MNLNSKAKYSHVVKHAIPIQMPKVNCRCVKCLGNTMGLPPSIVTHKPDSWQIRVTLVKIPGKFCFQFISVRGESMRDIELWPCSGTIQTWWIGWAILGDIPLWVWSLIAHFLSALQVLVAFDQWKTGPHQSPLLIIHSSPLHLSSA